MMHGQRNIKLSNLILPSHLRLGLTIGLFPSGFLSKYNTSDTEYISVIIHEDTYIHGMWVHQKQLEATHWTPKEVLL